MNKLLQMNVVTKIALGYLLIVLTLLFASFAGFNGTQRLSNSLDFITTKAWDTADGAMEGVINIQRQMLLTQAIVNAAGKGELLEANNMVEAESEANAALQRMFDAKQVPDTMVDDFKMVLAQFTQNREQVIQAAQRYVKSLNNMKSNAKSFVGFMMYIEEIGDGEVDKLENTPDKTLTWRDIKEPWAAADGAMEARIALLTRLNQYQLYIDNNLDVDMVQNELGKSLEELEATSQQIIALPAFNTVVPEGEFKGRIFTDVLPEILNGHKQTLATAITDFQDFKSAAQGFNKTSQLLLEKLDAMEEKADGAVEGEQSNIDSAISSSYSMIMIALVVGIGVSILAILFSIRFIVTPLVTVARNLKDISQGEGNLTVALDVKSKDEIGDIALGFNMFVEKIRTTIIKVSNSTEQLSTASENMRDITNTTSKNISQQQSETEQVATAMNEMTSTVAEVSTHAALAEESARSAQEHSEEGQRIVNETINVIDNLAQEVKNASDVILTVEKDSEQIGSVLDVIKGIAEQTNLLALNAAIEAARAGEQGRGFAVVADEVRTLASRTQESTQEIQAMIERLQASSKQAVTAMETGRKTAEDGVAFVSKAGESLNQITESVASINDMNTQIASAAEEQNAVAEEINRNISAISNISATSVGDAQQIANSSHALSALAVELKSLVNQFKI